MAARAFLVLGLILAHAVMAMEITQVMPNHIMGGADYRPGAAGKPAILILHGFLQTQDFPTVHNISEGLNQLGYTTLAPTLTLGIPYREKSMACDSIHTHSLRDDEAEIQTWLKWLEAKKPGPIFLVGHSTGSMELLAYLDSHPDHRVKKLIAASIIVTSLEGGNRERTKLIRELKHRNSNQQDKLIHHQFSFCDSYTATGDSLLSYLEWSPARVLDTAHRIPLPVTFIMGSDDHRIPRDWVEQLRKTGKKVRLIEGAGHFLDGIHEFELIDAIEDEIHN